MTDYLALSQAKRLRAFCKARHDCPGCLFHVEGTGCAIGTPFSWNLETEKMKDVTEYNCIDCVHFKQTKTGPLGAPKGSCTIKNYQDFRAGSHSACRMKFVPREEIE